MPNRLAEEPSPYLQQHANNPVDWYPWGEEAFEAARTQDKPLFVSIGYATCHWCHVMERESFENEEIARRMNEAFVNVKVDREERPDVDSIYMTVCQMLTGHGGWPLNVVLTPEQKPIFAGTYVPPTTRHGRIGMLELVPRLSQVWNNERERMESSAVEITALLKKEAEADLRSDVPGPASVTEAAQLLEHEYDSANAGFGQAPKFPMPHYIKLLLRHAGMTGSEKSLKMAASTLKAMARGGICDQVGLGFHRYATDREWLVPHFEKMLYDQALLLDVYVEAFQSTGDPDFSTVASDIASYVIRNLTSSDGGFYSAEDADSEGVEGKFYVWSMEELVEVLGKDDAETAAAHFNMEPEGNYLEESTRQRTGSNILHLDESADLIRSTEIESIRERLLEHRDRRIRPLLDDKILTDWNGLMIAALAKAGLVLEAPHLVEAAARAARFVKEVLVDDDGRLLHRFRKGESGIAAHLDDYAFFAQGCYELFSATHDASWLRSSLQLTEHMLEEFWDAERDGLFFASQDSSGLIVRRKEIQDGAIPSGLSAAVLNLARLGRILGRPDLTKRAAEAAASVARSISSYPTAHTALLCALGHLEGDGGEVVIAGSLADETTRKMVNMARAGFHPFRLTLVIDSSSERHTLFELAPHFEEYGMIDGRPTAYVCQDFVCQAPTTDLADLAAGLRP